ncbi:nose resistant to fluoxetine protein 6-like [Arctopsyche grandis]|uniref:nose resistant to fluoxetine protein 6-like n=1 Tax=Arctopsyche grandis TaxID=121162 RepID=UPI00406D97D4
MWLLIVLLGLTIVAGDDGLNSTIDDQLISHSPFYGLIATASASESVSTSCGRDLAKMAVAIVNRNRWIIKMVDASGMPKGGLHWGGTFWLGSRRQCEATQSYTNVAISPLGPRTIETIQDLPPFPTAYFVAYFQHHSDIQIITHTPDEFRMTLGLCLPKSCEEAELTVLLQKYFDSKMFAHQNLYNTSFQMEEVKKLVDDYSWLWELNTITMGIIIIGAVIMCITATILDVKYYRPMVESRKPYIVISKDANGHTKNGKNHAQIDEGLGFKIIKCFSVCETNKIIFNKKPRQNSISIIHGIKFFSMLSIILGHSITSFKAFYDNQVKMFHLSDNFWAQIVTVLQFSVDTFFCISGYLLASSFFQAEYNKSKTKKHNVLERAKLFGVIVLKRFLRLTPSYMITLGVTTVIFKWRYRATPFWNNERNDLTCPKYWWRNILYINNLSPQNEMCMSWSWYLSNDMQYFVITSFLLILSTMCFKTAASLMTVIFFGSISYTVYSVHEANFIPFLDEFFTNMETFYGNPIVRIGAYLIGVYAAYLVYHLKKTLPLSIRSIRLIWFAVFLLNMCILFGITDRDVSLAYSAAYTGLSRILWAVGISWALIICETRNGGVFTKIFGAKCWYPLSRLTYMAYLLNSVVLYLIMTISDYAYHIEVSNILFMGPALMVLSFAASYIFTILFESPSIALNKILFDYLKTSKETNTDNPNDSKSGKMPYEIVAKT